MRLAHLLCAATTTLCFLSCGNQLDTPEASGLSGKGDSNDSALSKKYSKHVAIDPAEELGTDHLRQLCCGAIAKHQPWTAAENQAFRMRCKKDANLVSVKRTGKWVSKLYDDHKDAQPLVMRMSVNVKDGDKTWDVTLQRRYSPQVFRLYWEAVHTPDATDPDVVNRNFIRDLANDLGEYFDYPGGPWDDRLKSIDLTQVPAELNTAIMSWLADQNDSMHGTDEAFLGDDHTAILDEAGEIIGYVIHVEFYIDHPLFDGGGVYLYYDATGHLIEEVEFWG